MRSYDMPRKATAPAGDALQRGDELERQTVAEFYQRCFDKELPESAVSVSLG
jgi:hypothetical protein